MSPSRTGLLCVVSGPSGSGKTTLCRALSAAEGCYYTVSATTRPARPGEVDGSDYHFLSDEEFRRRLEAGEFLESANVYGRLYGTLKSEALPQIARGREVIMDLDTQGAASLRMVDHPLVRAAHFDVFLLPPTLQELRRRLAGRHSDAPQIQANRLASALSEVSHWREYAYTLISGTREDDLARFRTLLAAERMRSSRLANVDGF
ncbi:MAG: guanylate kinase [Verrucomicrobiales bacterium]